MGACVYGVGACVYGNPMILVSAPVPLGLFGFLKLLGLGEGRVWGLDKSHDDKVNVIKF